MSNLKIDILTAKIIEEVYGKPIQKYKEYLKGIIQKELTIIQKELGSKIREKDSQEEHIEKLYKEYGNYPRTRSTLVYEQISRLSRELFLYETILNEIDELSLYDLDIEKYDRLDYKIFKIHDAFINKMVDAITDKLLKGESLL